MNEVLRIDRMLRDAAAKSAKLAEARANLPAGSSRARVTTANARWARAAEARGGLARRLAEAVEALRDPAEIAEVLAAMLRARGINATGDGTQAEGGYVAITWPAGNYTCASGMPSGPARAVIVRVAATTTAEDALKALEGT